MYGNTLQTDEIKELRKQGGQWLKSLREAAGFSQGELAQRLDMAFYSFISQIENGRGRIPPDRYEIWAQVLNVPTIAFVKTLLSYYDPVTYRILFESGVGAEADVTAVTRVLPLQNDVDRLSRQVRELERLLGKKTAELELLREQSA